MTRPDPALLARIKARVARARPDQLRRLLHDIALAEEALTKEPAE